MDNVESKVREIVARIAGLPFDTPADANLYLDLGVASVHALQLLAELETEFAVAVPDEEFVEANSIAQLTALMRSLAPSEEAEQASA
jgi:acyl carrier protein